MNRNKKGFNLFAHEMPFVLPQPIPEPPRVLNPRSMVPDLSITSDISLSGQTVNNTKDYFNKFKTLYLSPNQRSPPKEVPQFDHNFGGFATHLQQNREIDSNFNPKFDLNQTSNPRNGFNRLKTFNFNANNKMNSKNDIFSKRRLTEDKPIESQNTIKPKIVRHSMVSDRLQERNQFLNLETNNQTNTRNVDNCETNAKMMEIIRQQDLQLQRISEQIDELLRIQKIVSKEQNSNKEKKNMRSVQTMTSIILEDNTNLLNTHKNKEKSAKISPKTPSTASKDIRALRLNTISEYSEPSVIELDSNRLNFSESPVRRSSIERIRAEEDNNLSDPFYGQMINDIEVMLNNGSTEDSDSGRRSSCSPTPPHSRRQTQDRRHRIELQSEQTLYIKRLAKKYLSDESFECKTKHKHKLKHESNYPRNERTDLNVYGMTKNASIATKNYLEKYGLTYSPPKVEQNLNAFETNYRTKPKVNRNKILDIEALKRQHKLT